MSGLPVRPLSTRIDDGGVGNNLGQARLVIASCLWDDCASFQHKRNLDLGQDMLTACRRHKTPQMVRIAWTLQFELQKASPVLNRMTERNSKQDSAGTIAWF